MKPATSRRRRHGGNGQLSGTLTNIRKMHLDKDEFWLGLPGEVWPGRLRMNSAGVGPHNAHSLPQMAQRPASIWVAP